MFRPTVKTPPTEMPVSLEEVKELAVVDFDDDNILLNGLLAASVAHLDGFGGILGRAMVSQEWSVSRHCWRRDIALPVPDVSSVEIEYWDASGEVQNVPSEFIIILPITKGSTIILAEDFAFPALEKANPAPITVSFTCGFGAAADVPANLKLAVKALAAHWYEHRGSAKSATVPMTVSSLIQPYRWARV